MKENSKNPVAELSSDNGSFRLRIETYAYEYPQITSGNDADWTRIKLSLKAGAFRCAFDEACMRGGGPAIFLENLKSFSAQKINEVEFEPLDNYFRLKFSFNGRKNVRVSGLLQHPLGEGYTLEFDIETNLTYIDQFISGLCYTLERFPPR